MKITLPNEYGHPLRIKLPQPAWEGCEDVGTGISLKAIYIGNKYVILEYYSIWQNRNGECTGTYFQLAQTTDAHLLGKYLDDAQMDKACKVLGLKTTEA